MRAVTFDVNVRRYLVARSLGRMTDAALFGRLTGVNLSDVPEPVIPAADWVRLKVTSCGICGSDIGNLSYRSSPIMEPFGSFPCVPGHEILAVVEKVGSAVTTVEVGQRVVVDPLVSCVVRGYDAGDACVPCQTGNPGMCARAGEEAPLSMGGFPMARGLMIGYHRSMPGGWGERIIAHQSQLFPVADSLDDREGVLIEPLAISMRAVLRAGPPAASTDPVLVIGSGTIAFGTVWALRATGFQGPIIAQAKRKHEVRMHRLLGATDTVTPGPRAREAMVATGAMAYQPIVGQEVFSDGGFPLIYDCVGSRESISQALRFSRAGGTVVLLGCAGEVGRLDLSLLWARELTVRGFVGYGRESWRDKTEHTFQITQNLMHQTTSPLADMVTHVFPLGQFGTALGAAANHDRSEAIKVVLRSTGTQPSLEAHQPKLLTP